MKSTAKELKFVSARAFLSISLSEILLFFYMLSWLRQIVFFMWYISFLKIWTWYQQKQGKIVQTLLKTFVPLAPLSSIARFMLRYFHCNVASCFVGQIQLLGFRILLIVRLNICGGEMLKHYWPDNPRICYTCNNSYKIVLRVTSPFFFS